ncbi:MAG: CoA transferase, partial [SAR324 cluster bacterium]|nr:CoA transferase [SAR324 cluster bacterium]
GTDRLFNKVCTEVLQRPEICEDPRFIDNAGRIKHREELFALLNDAFGADSLESWLKKMRSAGVAAGPVRTVSQALASPEVQESGMITSVPHPTAGDLRMIGTPYRFSDTPPAEPVAPPLLGEHTEEVLRGLLGMDSAELARLREAGAIP